jgi:tetraacyldisaccharide 4'-kinase
MRARLHSLWYEAARPAWPLRALAWLFGVMVRARRAAYARGWLRSQRLDRPVLVVGNISVGGSGKTPLVIWLAAQLHSAGWAPGIVLRGYGGTASSQRAAMCVEIDSDPRLVGDEAVLLRVRTGLPVAICSERVAAARLLLAQGVNLIVSDDGLQHYALARDVEIAVIDAQYGLGNGYLLPAGPLRESRARLAQVDDVVLNGESAHWSQALRDAGPGGPFTMRLTGEWLWPLAGAGAPAALSGFAARAVHALAGIGHPQRFFAQLRAAGLEVIEHAFPDHHRYRAGELEFGDELPVLMSEKDAVKCRAFGGANRWYLPVAASFEETEAAALLARLQRRLESARQTIAGG